MHRQRMVEHSLATLQLDRHWLEHLQFLSGIFTYVYCALCAVHLWGEYSLNALKVLEVEIKNWQWSALPSPPSSEDGKT